MKIYVGNLEPTVSGSDLQTTFGAYGDVSSAKISRDNWSGVSRGFGFVEMAVQAQGEAAINGLNKKKPLWQVMPVHEGQTSLRLHRKETAKQALRPPREFNLRRLARRTERHAVAADLLLPGRVLDDAQSK